MIYQLEDDAGVAIDAHFSIEGDAVVVHARGGPAGDGAINFAYKDGFRLILQRLFRAGVRLTGAWVDSGPAQALPLKDRALLNGPPASNDAEALVKLLSSRMSQVGRAPGARGSGNSTKRLRLALTPPMPEKALAKLLRGRPAPMDLRSQRRLPADLLRRVTAAHLWSAVEKLTAKHSNHGFGESTDYDVITEDGLRLPPKAVFGLALEEALGIPILPVHFSGGKSSPCFRALEKAGYEIVPKGAPPIPDRDEASSPAIKDLEWAEGSAKLRKHLRRERSGSLRKAKIAAFRQAHDGKLFCERCALDPVAKFKTVAAEACIEVHHAATRVSAMREGHRTRLEDVQCLCANCHRLVHRKTGARG